MAPGAISTDGMVYSGTYSNVPVYELRVGSNLVMRRRSDNYINATHILKVADLDKPARTRVLEKEVQLGIHEKVQGGYGKYQGTWIPLDSGMDLAKKYSVFHILQPLFDFVPGAQSPPPAPKHATASSSRAKANKAAAAAAAAAAATAAAAAAAVQHVPHVQQHMPQHRLQQEHSYDYEDHGELPHEDESFDNNTIASQSYVDEDEYQLHSGMRKRKRGVDDMSAHRLWADSMLDYYVVSGSDPNHQSEYAPPPPPDGVDVNRAVDNEGHTALHWAASMGDIDYVKDLLSLGGDPFIGNCRGETPLVKCSIFANCYDKGTYQAMLRQLGQTLTTSDKYGATVLHHITKSTLGVPRANRARYYLDAALDQLEKNMSQAAFYEFVNKTDQNGDTAFHIAVRASRRCTRVFQAKGIPTDVPNKFMETVESMLRDKEAKNAQRREHMAHSGRGIFSSSPMAPSSPVFGASPATYRMADFLGRPKLSTKSSQSFSESMNNFYTTTVSSFVQAGEDEMNARDALITDLEAALSRINGQINSTQQECEILENEPVEDIAALSEERAQLSRDAEAYSEQMQHRFLHQAIRDGENKATRQKQDRSNGEGGIVNEDEIVDRIRLGHRLHQAQEKRKDLTLKLVESKAQAGMDEIGEMGLRVLCRALNTTREKLLEILPDLLQEMTMDRKNQLPEMELGVE